MISNRNGKLPWLTQVQVRAQCANERDTPYSALNPQEATYGAWLFLKMSCSEKSCVTFVYKKVIHTSQHKSPHFSTQKQVLFESYNPNYTELNETNLTSWLIKQCHSRLCSCTNTNISREYSSGFYVVKGKQGLKYSWTELLLYPLGSHIGCFRSNQVKNKCKKQSTGYKVKLHIAKSLQLRQ